MSVEESEQPEDDNRKSIALRVEEIAKGSAGRFMCRIDNSVLHDIDIKPGEIIRNHRKKEYCRYFIPIIR